MVSGGSACGDIERVRTDRGRDGYIAYKHIRIHWSRTNVRGLHGWVHVRNICEITMVIIALRTSP